MILIREANVSDAKGIARVQVESWRTTYPGIIPDAYLVNLAPETSAMRWKRLLATEDPWTGCFVAEDFYAGIIGYAMCGRQRSRLRGYGGEFYALYLLEDFQGLGLGRRLLAVMASSLLSCNIHSGVVWVLEDNPARWFYERLGGHRIAEQGITFAGGELSQTAFGWRDLVPLARSTVDSRDR